MLDEQLEVPHHALQRVVHLVRDPGDELAERRQLFRLREALAQRGALGLEPRLPRDVARDEHAPQRVPSSALVSGVAVSRNVPSAPQSSTRALHRRGTMPCHVSAGFACTRTSSAPTSSLSGRAHDVGALQSDARANASLVWTMRSSLSIDGDEIDERVEACPRAARRWRRMSSSSWTFSTAADS